MLLEQKDIKEIERIVFTSIDDVACAIARHFERLDDRLDTCEMNFYRRLADLENLLAPKDE